MKRFSLPLTALLLGPLAVAQDLTVFAASSLTEAFGEIASVFEGQNEGVEVLLSFDGSSTLATQIVQGAPADVFASADENQMRVVVDEGLTASEPQIFTGNRLVLITPEDSDITRLEQLAEPGVLLVLAAPDVPVGNYAREALEKMNAAYGADFSKRVLENLVSEESNVRQVSLKVELGEADAAIVYATDATVAEGVHAIDIPDDLNVLGTYPITTLRGSAQPKLAQAFVDLVLSDEGRTILTERGFQVPE
ncbi:MAG: Molybdenum ABC transporter, substrate-binding protein ModA [uncultured Truepera sp.]|uniref:Molybdenum ABC transporter, substrate-binding protein ModA n=1 Tax=uncultured Truepera sp. TaxID=543023 RepID=A0A6J4VJE9_9DEIN|nr:MAG: Molybdenum ABC transporter, substrate-binding protein ModA [uncultured Truepera sp.]